MPAARSRFLQTVRHFDREWHVSALTAKAKAHFFWAGDLTVTSIRKLRKVAAMHEGLENPIDRSL